MDDDWYDKLKKNIVKQIVRDGYSHAEADVYCPHCGSIKQDTCEILLLSDIGDVQEITECGECEKKFKIKWEAVYDTEKV